MQAPACRNVILKTGREIRVYDPPPSRSEAKTEAIRNFISASHGCELKYFKIHHRQTKSCAKTFKPRMGRVSKEIILFLCAENLFSILRLVCYSHGG